MEKRLQLTLLMAFSALVLQVMPAKAQLKAKLKAKMEALDKKLAEASGGGVEEIDFTQSLSVTAATWEDGSYEWYKSDGSGIYGGPESEKLAIKFTKNDKNEVTKVMIDETAYVADEAGKSDFVRFYLKESGSQNGWNLFFTDNRIIAWVWRNGTPYWSATIGGKTTYEDMKNVQKYVEETKQLQEADLAAYEANVAAASDKAEAERRAKFSIEGKEVASISIKNIFAPEKFGHYRSFNFSIEAKLKNGSTISTADGGYRSDYIIEYQNSTVSEANRTVPVGFVKDDKIVIKVKSKYNPAIKTSADVVLNYDEDLFFSNNAKNWGKSAFNYKLEVKQVKHASNGTDLLMVKLIDLSGYDKPQIFKIRADQTIHLNTDGANGYKTVGTGNDTGPGQNAGDGGNITVIKDPSVKSFNINYTMKGGTGGAGTYGYNRGRDGRDGTYKEEVRAVNF